MYKKIHIVVFLLIFVVNSSISQNVEKTLTKDISVHESDNEIGVMMKTPKGLGLQALTTKKINYKTYHLVNLTFRGLNHPKEIKQQPQNNSSYSFVYGKTNAVSILQAGYGIRRILARSEQDDHIKINYNVVAGPEIAFLKPIYYDIFDPDNPARRRSEKFDPQVHNFNNLIGASPFTKGFGEISLAYGLHVKNSLSFDWNAYGDSYFSLEPGIMLDVFPQDLPIFAIIDGTNRNQAIYLNVFITLSYGFRK